MAIKIYKGKVKTEWLPVTVSTAFTKNTLVKMTSGYVAVADDNDTALAGIIQKTIASTDSDYATARKVGVTVPRERHVIYDFTGQSGFAASNIGGEFGISDAGTLDVSDTTNKVFLMTEYIDPTHVRGYLKINGSY